MRIQYLLLVLLLLRGGLVRAQPELRNWRFGVGAGLVFPPSGPPAAAAISSFASAEACSAISDAAGSLRCSTNGVQVWDRTDTPMPNGALRFGRVSATQGALLVPSPGNTQEYYLFTVDSFERNLVGGLHYSVVEMNLRGGLGDIGTRKELAVPLTDGQTKLTEKLTAVLLPNGRDYWILVHGWETNKFYSFLLTPAGLQPVPVISSVGSVHHDFNASFDPYADALGYLRVSADARRLAVARLTGGIEVFDFDSESGRVTNAHPIAITLPGVPNNTYYGLEFSADGTKLYTTSYALAPGMLTGQGLCQIDLANRDAVTYLGLDVLAHALLRGNDNRLYVSRVNATSLAVITAPNAAGLACGLQGQGLALATGSRCQSGLPNFVALPPVRLVLNAASTAGCLGQPAVFSAAVVPAVPNAVFTWDFGDPAAGVANAAVGSAARHTYAAAGTYVVTVSAVLAGGGTLTARQTITVAPTPTLNLAPHQQVLCGGLPLVIEANAQPAGTTYRWHDGLATAAREVRSAGRYVLTVTSPAGCAVSDSVDVRDPLPTDDCIARRVPNIITPNGDGQNDTFVLGGLLAPSWSLTIFNRWGREVFQQASYDNGWAAPGLAGGIYYYLLLNPATGTRLRGWVLVSK
ncbi:MAG: gliding motility-associated C-terminal domain-containing protein [Janthinobacterium lividum]